MNDPAHQFMANDVATVEIDEINSGDAFQNRLGMDEATDLVSGKVNLRDVAGHDEFG